MNNKIISALKAEMKEFTPSLYVTEGLTLKKTLETFYTVFGGYFLVPNLDRTDRFAGDKIIETANNRLDFR